MKLVCLNVGLFEKNNDKLNEFLTSVQPDIACLQEVTRENDDQVNRDFVSYGSIRKATRSLPYSFYSSSGVLSYFEYKDFHGSKVFRKEFGGFLEFGCMVVSKFEFIKGLGVFVQKHQWYRTNWDSWPDDDSRVVQIVDMEIDNKSLRVINYHGIWTKNKQGTSKAVQACEVIKRLAMEAKGAVIIAGDFNLFPDTPAMKLFLPEFESLLDRYDLKTTRPESNELSGYDRNVVDYILVNEQVEVRSFEVVVSDVSDHLPLVMDFDLVG